MTLAKDPSGTIVHEIRWSDALPWWLLFRAAGAAFSPAVIVLAACGMLATWAGWSAADRAGFTVAAALATPATPPAADELVLPTGQTTMTGDESALRPSRRAVPWIRDGILRLPLPLREVLALVTVPFRPTATLSACTAASCRLAWFILVWSIFGTAICRNVALKLVGEEPPGIVGGAWFGSRKWLAAFNAVLFVIVGMLVLSIPGTLLGLGMRTDIGLAFAGAVWPLVLLGAVVLAILGIGMVIGWPLMVAAVGIERGDSFQAISTAFSYLYQRPLHYAFYAVVAAAVVMPALAVAGLFADATGTLAVWATSFGMGHDRTADLVAGLAGSGAMAGQWGTRAIAFWSRGLLLLLAAFGWGYFWAIATAAYMLLRQDVDGTELDEVVLDEPGGSA